MRFLGGKRRNKNNSKTKAIDSVASPFGLRSSLRQSGMAYRPAIRRRAEARLYLEARAAAMKGCLSFMTACYFDRNDDFLVLF